MRPETATRIMIVLTALGTGPAWADVRVQDVSRLKGQRTNRLMGYGLVVGLNGTGDGSKYPATMRALMAIHQRYEQPILDINDLKTNSNVALVMVEATIPEYGAREGEMLDVIVSAENTKSLAGGQLLTTPLQFAMFDSRRPESMRIFALAGGRVDIPDPENPRRGIIRRGATLEEDLLYRFIEDQHITLILDDRQAGFQLAHLLARAINHEVANTILTHDRDVVPIAATELAYALGPKNVRVRIPPQEMQNPTAFISRVLQTSLFIMPDQIARVVINRTTKQVTFTGTVTISPTVLLLPGLGTVSIGGRASAGGPTGVVDLDTDKVAGVEFQELLSTLSKVKLTPQQTIEAIEQLHRTGTLHAELIYAE